MNAELSISTAIDMATDVPKDLIIQAEKNVPGGIEALQKINIIDARKAMNAFSTISNAIIEIKDSPQEEKMESFKNIMENAENISAEIINFWGFNPKENKNRWMVNVVEKNIIPVISHLIKNKLNNNDLIKEVSLKLAEKSTNFNAPLDYQNIEVINLAIMDGVSKLIIKQSDYNFFRKKTLDKDIEYLRDIVINYSIDALEQICPKTAPKEEKVKFLSIIIKQCFAQMLISWEKYEKHTKELLTEKTKEDRLLWKKANPNGWPIKPIEDYFRHSMNRVIRLTSNLKLNSKK